MDASSESDRCIMTYPCMPCSAHYTLLCLLLHDLTWWQRCPLLAWRPLHHGMLLLRALQLLHDLVALLQHRRDGRERDHQVGVGHVPHGCGIGLLPQLLGQVLAADGHQPQGAGAQELALHGVHALQANKSNVSMVSTMEDWDNIQMGLQMEKAGQHPACMASLPGRQCAAMLMACRHLTTARKGRGRVSGKGEGLLAAHAVPCMAFMFCKRAARPL